MLVNEGFMCRPKFYFLLLQTEFKLEVLNTTELPKGKHCRNLSQEQQFKVDLSSGVWQGPAASWLMLHQVRLTVTDEGQFWSIR